MSEWSLQTFYYRYFHRDSTTYGFQYDNITCWTDHKLWFLINLMVSPLIQLISISKSIMYPFQLCLICAPIPFLFGVILSQILKWHKITLKTRWMVVLASFQFSFKLICHWLRIDCLLLKMDCLLLLKMVTRWIQYRSKHIFEGKSSV